MTRVRIHITRISTVHIVHGRNKFYHNKESVQRHMHVCRV